KLLALEGSGPSVDACVQCGEADNLVAFSELDGGLVCADHRRGAPISPEAVALLQRILGGQLGAALNEPESGATREVGQVSIRALEHFLERRMRTTSVMGEQP
ncbi:MAG: DNA repair protein RecO, partial [Acidimicrobiales bacterium]